MSIKVSRRLLSFEEHQHLKRSDFRSNSENRKDTAEVSNPPQFFRRCQQILLQGEAREVEKLVAQVVGQVGSSDAHIGALLQSFPKMGSRSLFTTHMQLSRDYLSKVSVTLSSPHFFSDSSMAFYMFWFLMSLLRVTYIWELYQNSTATFAIS